MSNAIVSMFTLPETISAEYYDSVEYFSRGGIWQLCYRNISDKNVSIKTLSELSELCFNTETIFPPHLQEQAAKVSEDGKHSILKSGTQTGKGVKVAVIDRPINKNHIEFKGRIEYIEVLPDDEKSQTFDFHGMTCASLLCGATCGVAPEAELVYFAVPNRMNPIGNYYGYQLTALQRIIDYNKSGNAPIKIVSLSAPFTKEQIPLRAALVEELNSTGCHLIDVTMFGKNFKGIDFTLYTDNPQYILNRWQIDNYELNKGREGFRDYFANLCFVPSSRRTSASNDSDNSYIHWSKAVSESWTIPHAAGVYALCLQVNPALSYDEFVFYAKQCPRKDGKIILDTEFILRKVY